MKTKNKLAKISKFTPSKEVFKDVGLLKFARKKYYEYGVEVLEDRAFPDFRDGLNPVNRRLLWSAYDLGIRSNSKSVKSARIVGDVLGRFHPHGDSAAYGALVKMTNTNTAVPLFTGDGNWGSLSDKGFAAMRYTETKLSKFSDEILFNKFYTPVIDYVPNYDGSGKEPLVLPALLPIALINGRFGIAPGATTNIPICDYKSILKALFTIYSETNPLDGKELGKILKFKSTYGGEEGVQTKEERLDRNKLFTSTEGKTTLWSSLTYNEGTRTVTVTKFARDTDMEKLLTSLLEVQGIHSASDDSSTKDLYGKLTITFKKGLKEEQYKKLLDLVTRELSSRENYVLNFTERFIDPTGQSAAKVVPMSLTDMLGRWVEWRTQLEKKACSYWIAEDDREIRRIDLLIQAVDLIDYIVSLLKNSKLDTEGVYAAYASKTKVKPEEAKYVLGRPIITLRKLDKEELLTVRKKVEVNKSFLEKRRKDPKVFMANQVKSWLNFV